MNEKLIKIAACLEELAAAVKAMASDAVAPVTLVEEAPVEAIPEEKIKLEDVRAVLADLSRQGHTKEMKGLLARFGAARLSDVPEEKYGELLAAAKEVANA